MHMSPIRGNYAHQNVGEILPVFELDLGLVVPVFCFGPPMLLVLVVPESFLSAY